MTGFPQTLRRWALIGGCTIVSLSGQAMAQQDGPVIVLINPNSSDTATRSMAELAQAEVGAAATVMGKSNAGAPALLTTPKDMADAVPGAKVRFTCEGITQVCDRFPYEASFYPVSDPAARVRIAVLVSGEEAQVMEL